MKKIKSLLIITGLTLLLVNATYWARMFFITYFSESKEIIHAVNLSGEANIEFIFMIIHLVIMIPTFFLLLKREINAIKT